MESRVREHGPDARGMVGMVAVGIVFSVVSSITRQHFISLYSGTQRSPRGIASGRELLNHLIESRACSGAPAPLARRSD
jgi:hypothetical protein